MRRVDLAESVVLTASGITRLLDGLERLGYVTKRQCAADARVSYAVISPAGRTALKQATEMHHAALAEIFGSLFTRKELDTLNELLARLPGAADDVVCTLGEDS